MKVFAFAIVLAIVVAAQAKTPKLSFGQLMKITPTITRCLFSSGANPFAVRSLFNGNFDSTSEKSKCFMKCYVEHLNFVEKGVLNKEVVAGKMTTVVGADNAKIIIDICDKVKGGDTCNNAFEIFKCQYYVSSALLA